MRLSSSFSILSNTAFASFGPFTFIPKKILLTAISDGFILNLRITLRASITQRPVSTINDIDGGTQLLGTSLGSLLVPVSTGGGTVGVTVGQLTIPIDGDAALRKFISVSLTEDTAISVLGFVAIS